MPVVVRFVLVLPLLLFEQLGALLWSLVQARVELVSFICDGMFPKFGNLEDQESELLCPPSSMELWGELRGLFLQWYPLHPKFLHVARIELEGAIFDSLRVVRCRSLVIFHVLG